MSAKPLVPFGKGPRPKMTDEERARVTSEVAGLAGFDRPLAGEGVQPVPETAPEPAPTPALAVPLEPTVQPQPPATKPVRPKPAPAPEPVVEATENLRIPVTQAVWDELTLAAHKRRVTVRYLCLEALSKAGYGVDMSKVPADGRRIKKRQEG